MTDILQFATALFGFGVLLLENQLTALCVVLPLGAGALLLASFFSNFAYALRTVMIKGAGLADIIYPDLLALAAFFAIFFAAATVMLRREVG